MKSSLTHNVSKSAVIAHKYGKRIIKVYNYSNNMQQKQQKQQKQNKNKGNSVRTNNF